ncbi:hypothetical protein CLOM_g20258 [Closterium sp. NIES-68]|nr:hypothetical protein CLOM_g20258 [Closterium sp. NIES-68]
MGDRKDPMQKKETGSKMKSAAEGDRSAGRIGPESAAGHSTVYFSTASKDGGIAPEFGYFKFSPHKIVVPRLLEGRLDLASWVESIEPQLEIARVKRFVDGSTEAPPVVDASRYA